jgi:hypothetical protein
LAKSKEIEEAIIRPCKWAKILEEKIKIPMAQESGKYTKPGMRERIKDRIMAGSKGGKPGQWSARKAQLLAQEYEKSGGDYRGGKGKSQKSLEKWGKEKWMTKDEYEKRGKAKAAAKKYKDSK